MEVHTSKVDTGLLTEQGEISVTNMSANLVRYAGAEGTTSSPTMDGMTRYAAAYEEVTLSPLSLLMHRRFATL